MPKKQIEQVKITKEKSLAFINRIVNVASHEWPRVIYCFMLKLFVDMGKVIGHTILLSMVASRLGIDRLPYVMVISSILVMISTTFFSRLLYKIDKKYILIGLAVSSTIMLILSRLVLSFEESIAYASGGHEVAMAAANHTGVTYLFFAVYLIAEAVLFIQLEIILALYIEDYFTPLESQRTFPVIESAQIFAGIIGGSLITFLHWDTPDYIFLWALCLLSVTGLIAVYNILWQEKAIINIDDEHAKIRSAGIFKELKGNIRALKLFPFLKVTTLVVFLYYAIYQILEFKYTKAFFVATGEEKALTHGLGVYILVFSTGALLIQLLLSSRLIRSMGVINSMILNPLFSLMSFFIMLFFSGTNVVISSKFIFDTTSVVYKNAYLSSYYAISHNVREKMKALIEGWIIPSGMIFGTLFVILFQMIYDAKMDLFLRILLVSFATISIILLFKQRKNYTSTAMRNLDSMDIHERFNAIEVLGQQGHVESTVVLMNKLQVWMKLNKYKREKIKILETLGYLKDETVIPAILNLFRDADREVRLAAVNALTNFKSLGDKFYTQTFARYRIINDLKHLFEKENSKTMKSQIIRVFANLRQLEVVPFLLDVLKNSGDEIKADCIHVIGKFNDPNIAYYLKPYLESNNARIKANTIIALWQFKEMRLDLLLGLTIMLEADLNKNKDMLLSGIYAAGQVGAKQEEKKLLQLVQSNDLEVRRHAAIALAKIGNKESLPHILELMFRAEKKAAYKIKVMLKDIKDDFREKLMSMIEHEASLRISRILKKYGYDQTKLSTNDLKTIVFYYDLIDKQKEIIKIEKLQEKMK